MCIGKQTMFFLKVINYIIQFACFFHFMMLLQLLHFIFCTRSFIECLLFHQIIRRIIPERKPIIVIIKNTIYTLSDSIFVVNNVIKKEIAIDIVKIAKFKKIGSEPPFSNFSNSSSVTS